MKKFLKILFIVLGAIFFLIIIAAVVFAVVDPFNLKSFIQSSDRAAVETSQSATNTSSPQSDDSNPLISAEQEAKIESFGINPASLPAEITPEMEQCFAEKLGEARVAEIVAGATPGVIEFGKVSSCF